MLAQICYNCYYYNLFLACPTPTYTELPQESALLRRRSSTSSKGDPSMTCRWTLVLFQTCCFRTTHKCSFSQLNTEAGQIKYLGEATLGGQCHVPYMQAMLQSSWGQSPTCPTSFPTCRPCTRALDHVASISLVCLCEQSIQCIFTSFMFYSV